ncbi:DoxX family protein [uncultured Croceitalea sp.]|uniref:DoxX family protein n=1 Tax=uncultured Croceitalea sp. TaxID=1798908 RepID=UPI003305F46F
MKTTIQRLLATHLSFERTSMGLLIFRIVLAISLLNTHGLKKILHFEETLQHIPDPFGFGSEFSTYFAIFANVVCPIFIIAGLFTRLAIIPILSITLSGFFIVHFNDPWPVKDVPLMYSLSFMLLLYLGPGRNSLDNKFLKKMK